MEFRAVERTTLVDVIIEQIKGSILKGDLEPGVKLPTERELAEKFSVSRTTVREVLKGLLGIGVLTHNREGTFISNDVSSLFTDHLTQKLILGRINITDLFETRKILEVQNVALACERGPSEDMENIYARLKRNIEALDDDDKFNCTDIAFHEAIAFAAQNRVLFELFTAVRHLVWEANKSIEDTDILKKISLEFHKGIYEAIKERDAERAKRIMLEHIEYGEDIFFKLNEYEHLQKA